MAEFRVVIEGLELDEHQTVALNDEIQRVVLQHLAGHDLTKRKPQAVVAFRPHPEWYGLIAAIVAKESLPQVAELSQRFG